MRRPYCVVLVAACKFTPGELRDGDVPNESIADDAPAGTCYERWLAGTIRFGTPVPLNEVNAAEYDRDPYLTPDELQIFVSSGRFGSMGGGAVWTAKRTSRTALFPPLTVATSFETVQAETKLSLTADGLYAFLGSTLDTANEVDVWEATRATPTSTWSALGRGHLAAVNTSGSDHDPTISADGLRLYLAPHDGTTQRLAVATRTSTSASFATPALLTELISGVGEADPSPSPDERILLFSSNRATVGPLAPNIWYATRGSIVAAFGTPAVVPDINSDLPDGDPHLSADGCRIYFGREVNAQTYNWDIFVATALP